MVLFTQGEGGPPPFSKEQGMNRIELTNRAVQLDQQFVVASRGVLHEGMVVTFERLSIFLLISPFSPPPLPRMCEVKENRNVNVFRVQVVKRKGIFTFCG